MPTKTSTFKPAFDSPKNSSISLTFSYASALPSPTAAVKRFLDMLLLSGKSGLTLVQLRQIIAIRARDLRWAAEINLKGADAIHVATAMEMKCDELWTQDGGIWKKQKEIGEMGLRVVIPRNTTTLPEDYRHPDLQFGPSGPN